MPSSQPPSTLSDLIKSHPLFTRTRLTSLYSDFRPLIHTNPDGYSANISAWLSLLSDATRAGLISNSSLPDTLVLTINASLVSSLASDSQARPLAIGAVISESLKTKELIPLGIFLNQVESIYTSRSYIQAIGGWVLSKLPIPAILIGGSSTSAPNVSEEIINRQTTHYVVVKNLEEAAQQVLAEFSSKRSGRVSEIWTFENFIQEFANPFFNSTKSSKAARFSENDAKVLLRYLERDLKEISMSGQTIKFKPTTSPTPIPVTPTDVTIANLKATISITQTSLNNLTSSSNTLTTRAKSHLSASNKPAAIATLRTKKAIDAHISSRASSLNQLETLLFQIETAADNVTLVSLLESGGHALKNLNKEIGSVERVDEVLEKVKEAGEDAEEISRILNTGLGQEGVVDEEDVEEELEEIMRLQREEETRKGVQEYDRRAKEAEEKARREAEDLASSLEILDLKSPQGEPERRMELENV